MTERVVRKAVLLVDVDDPAGSATAVAQLWAAVQEIRESGAATDEAAPALQAADTALRQIAWAAVLENRHQRTSHRARGRRRKQPARRRRSGHTQPATTRGPPAQRIDLRATGPPTTRAADVCPGTPKGRPAAKQDDPPTILQHRRGV
jgi:hypothetical protein